MQIGFFAVGIGPSANPELLALAARAVEQCGFHSLWTGEHVVLVSQYSSKYPYTQDGKIPAPTTKIDILDPFATLTFAAANTKTVRLGTGICHGYLSCSGAQSRCSGEAGGEPGHALRRPF